MKIVRDDKSATAVNLVISADEAELRPIKQHVLNHLASGLKIPGFRPGKAPGSVAEKQVDPQKLSEEFINDAVNTLYSKALTQENLRPVDMPKITITKFVPYDSLEFSAEITVISPVKLAKYDNLKATKLAVEITAKDVNEVLENLQIRLAEKNDVSRASKEGDQVWIDFDGTDKDGKPVAGASGKDYPLVLGSNTFIPGFEPELVGLKAEETKKFDITFPGNYGVAALQNKAVTFEVKVTKVQEVVKPKLDDEFAAKAGPFTSLADLKADIKKQVGAERRQQADRQYENELIFSLANASSVDIPDVLIDQQVMKMEDEEKRNLVYRGQTWQEHLDQEKISEEEHRLQKRPEAAQQVKAGLVLSELAEREKIQATPEEIEIRLQILRSQYKDPAMQAELNKPENRQDITARLLTEKTIARLVELNS